jgi:hypothetical protein
MPVSSNIIKLNGQQQFKSRRGDVVEYVYFPAKNFTLQEVTTRLRHRANEMAVYFTMPSDYIPDDTATKSAAIKTSRKGKTPVTIMLTWQADSTIYCCM